MPGPAKPQVFKAPDGKEFSTRQEWRNYMMATFYSWKNLKNETAPLIKNPGDVDGQVFDISDCSGCTLVILDVTEAVQIDGLSNCRVFIGCCVSSIFIRNCTGCIFYTCCRQLRLREVVESSLYVYSQAEVHIEQSTGLAFAPFNGGYNEQAAHFAASNLLPENNLWYDVFDHNDPAKSRVNWRLLERDEMEPSWFPQGVACTPCVTVTAPKSVQALDSGKDSNQVGQAFGMDQLAADAARMQQEAAVAAAAKLTMESALLVASALGKGIDVSLWLTEGSGKAGRQPLQEFENKLISLGLTVGVEEDWDTKRELEVATSKSSLRNIAEVCGKGKDARTGAQLIDVTLFIAAAQEKVAAYLAAAEGEEEGEAEIGAPKAGARGASRSAERGESETEVGHNASVYESGFDDEIDEIEEDLAADDDDQEFDGIDEPETIGSKTRPSTASASASASGANRRGNVNAHGSSSAPEAAGTGEGAGSRPMSARGSSRVDQDFAASTLPSTSSPERSMTTNASSRQPRTPIIVPAEATEAFIPDSPYDEEVAFDLDGEEEAETVLNGSGFSNRYGAPRSSSSSSTKGKANARVPSRSPGNKTPASVEGVSNALNTSGGSNRGALQPPRPSSAGPRIRARPSSSTTNPAASSSAAKQSTARRSASAGPMRASNATSVLRSSLSATPRKKFNVLVDAEDRVRYALRTTDFYHLVQVHLGFITAAYTHTPYRGVAVPSVPRPWLSIRDIKDAFAAARMNFSESTVLAIMHNVMEFALQKDPGMPAMDIVRDDGHGNKLAAEHLKAYLVHVRLTKKAPYSRSASDDIAWTMKSSASGASAAAMLGSDNEGAAELGLGLEDGMRGSSSGGEKARVSKPIEWREWLGKKVQKDEQAKSAKPREFLKALAGREHTLSKEELEVLLRDNEIIPQESMKTEVSQRVRSWVLDIDGRMDYLHSLNVEKRRYQKDNQVTWRSLTEERRRQVELELKRKLVTNKTEALYASERNSIAITRELFGKYERFCKSVKFAPALTCTWGVWLGRYHGKNETAIKRFKEDCASRGKASQDRKSRLKTVAPLAEVERQLSKAAESLTTFHSIELRKSLIALRKTALDVEATSTRRRSSTGGAPRPYAGSTTNANKKSNSTGAGAGLVSKESFERHLDKVLAPRLKELPEEMKVLAVEARRSHDGLAARSDAQFSALVDTLFKQDESEAVARMLQIEAEAKTRKEEDFARWTREKKEKREKEEEKRKQVEEDQRCQRAKREKVSQKAFKTWCKLRKDNKYVSKVVVVAPSSNATPNATSVGTTSSAADAAAAAAAAENDENANANIDARPVVKVKKVVKPVPELRRVTHFLKWNKEAELPGYTYSH